MRQLSSEDRDLIADAIAEGATTLPDSVLEKDIHLTGVLNLIAEQEFAGDLIFCGGTSLSKAYGLINRMSEDLDFKATPEPAENRASSGKSLKQKVQTLDDVFVAAGFVVTKNEPRDSGNSRSLNLQYKPTFERSLSLRPEIKVEVVTNQALMAPMAIAPKTFLLEALGLPETNKKLACLQVDETFAEKLAAFLRKAHPSKINDEFDGSIIRHVYDIHLLSKTYAAIDFVLINELFSKVVENDIEKGLFKSFATASGLLGILRETVANLTDSQELSSFYATFVKDLVLETPPSYEDITATFAKVANSAISHLK